MNRNKVLLRTCENFSRTPRKTYKSPSQDYVPPASVFYKRLTESFGYEFEIDDNDEKAMQIVKKIVSIMESQSYDHGSEWRNTKIEIISKDREIYESCVVRAYFRIKDSY